MRFTILFHEGVCVGEVADHPGWSVRGPCSGKVSDDGGNFHAHGVLLTGNQGEDVNRDGFQSGGDVVGKGANLIGVDPGGGVKLIASPNGVPGDVANGNRDVKLRERLLRPAAVIVAKKPAANP